MIFIIPLIDSLSHNTESISLLLKALRNYKTLEANYIQATIKKWLIHLYELKQGNIILKNKLSEALKSKVSRSFVEQLDLYQQKIIAKDQIIDLLRHDITALLSKPTLTSKLEIEANTLETDINRISIEFNQMKIELEEYLSK